MNTEPQISKRPRCQSEPTDPAAFFPEDLIVEIISWLTVKPLMKMKCVSKSFKILISDPNFVKLHLNRSSRNRLSYLVSYKDDWKKDDYSSIPFNRLVGFMDGNLSEYVPSKYDYDCSFVPFSVADLLENPSIIIPDEPYYCLIDKDCRKVVGSCNGLVCLLGSSKQQTWFRLWNPATRTISNKLGFLHNDNYRYKLTDWRFTFGYDSSTDTYKVVALSRGNGLKTEVRVLNFGDNIWRSIQSFPAWPLELLLSSKNNRGFSGVHLNGTVNWLAMQIGHRFMIISLDLSTETYKILRIPRFPLEKLHVLPTLCALKGYLFLYYDVKRDFIIWMMKKFGDYKSWTSYHLHSNHDILHMNMKYDVFSCFNLYMNGDTLLYLQDEKVTIRNIRNRTVKAIVNNKICWLSMNDYVESLVPTC